MKNPIPMFRTLMIMAAMTGFAAGAWAQEAGEEVTGGDEIFQTGVVDEGATDEGATDDVADGGEVSDPEVIYYMTGAGGEEEVVDAGEPIMDGEGVVTGYTDADGNVIYFRSDSVDGAGDEEMMYTLASRSGAAGSFMSVSDATAEQGSIDGTAGLGLDVVDAQAGFAGPIDVQATTAAAAGGTSASGTATRISGGHLTVSSPQ